MSSTFWRSARTPSATSNETEVARDRPVEDEPNDRLVDERTRVAGVPVSLDLAPGPADHILADRARKRRGKRTSNPPRVGPGKIGAGDQSIGGSGAALIGRKRGAPPFARLVVLAQLSKSKTSAATAASFVVSFVMVWSPFLRANAGIIGVKQPGDYANPIPTTSATGPKKEFADSRQAAYRGSVDVEPPAGIE